MALGVREDLAGVPAGAALCTAIEQVPLPAVPNDRILDRLRAQRRQASHEEARLAATLYELARCSDASVPGAVVRRDGPDEWAPDETRAALALTNMSAEAEHALAEFVIGYCPRVFAAWDAGDIDRARVRVFEQYLFGLTTDQIAAVCTVAIPQAPRLTTGELAALLRRLVIAVDPDAAARWYRRRLRERRVCGYLTADGTVTITAIGLPPDEAEAACRRVERLAAAARRAGAQATADQLRSDTFLGLLDGRFHHLDDEQIVASLTAAAEAQQAAGATEVATTAVVTETGSAHGTVPGAEQVDTPNSSGSNADGSDVERPNAVAGPDGTHPDEQNPVEQGPVHTGPAGPRPDDPSGPMPDEERRRRGTGGNRPGDQRRGIEIRIALSTLLGHDDHPGEIPGLGPVHADIARARAMLQTRAEWRFAVIGPDGTLLSEGITRRRPDGATRTGSPPGGIVEIHIPIALLDALTGDPSRAGAWAAVVADIATRHQDYAAHLDDLDARPRDRFPGTALRRHTEIRDRGCTFPGCRRPAHACAQDHHHDHTDGGPTTRTNLGPVCAGDHLLKHRAGWTVTGDEEHPGATVWNSPLGGHYPVRGHFLGTDPLDPCPGLDLGPDTTPAGPPADVDAQPILRRPPPVAEPPTSPAPCRRPRGDPFTRPDADPTDDDPPPF